MYLGPSKGRSGVPLGQIHIPRPLRGQLQGQLCVLGSSRGQLPVLGSLQGLLHIPGSPRDQLHIPRPHGGQPQALPRVAPEGGPELRAGAAAVPGLPQDESRSRLQPRASMSLLMWEIMRSHSSSSEGTDCSSELPAAPVPLEAEAAPSERR